MDETLKKSLLVLVDVEPRDKLYINKKTQELWLDKYSSAQWFWRSVNNFLNSQWSASETETIEFMTKLLEDVKNFVEETIKVFKKPYILQNYKKYGIMQSNVTVLRDDFRDLSQNLPKVVKAMDNMAVTYPSYKMNFGELGVELTNEHCKVKSMLAKF